MMNSVAVPPLLEINSLWRTYAGAQPVHALHDVSFTIQPGEFLAIIGPSGSGKSTLMNVLGLLDTPTQGSLMYHGEETAHWSEGRKSRFRNEEIGFIFQAHLLLPEFTALENVLMPSRIAGTLNRETEIKAEALLERIGMGERKHFKPSSLSGGQNQRVAIARALVNQPSIVFADEPTGALDYKTSQAVYDLMRDIHRDEGATFVIVTHERELARKADRVLTMLDGRLQSDETVAHTQG
jgi:ABC-type lipoprotein export system ATPase subunit